LKAAAGAFLGLQQNEVAKAAEETLEGHQRAILGFGFFFFFLFFFLFFFFFIL